MVVASERASGTGIRVPPDAQYICLDCGQAFQWSSTGELQPAGSAIIMDASKRT